MVDRTGWKKSALDHDDWREDQRGHVIMRWLGDRTDIEQWAVVDDDDDMDALPEGHFVHTTWDDGLTEEHADRLIEILNS